MILPGWCQGDLKLLEDRFQTPFELGPKDLHDLPEFFGRGERPAVSLEDYTIEILAEINHAPHLSEKDLFAEAERFRESGADVIDSGLRAGRTLEGSGPHHPPAL